jgi:hypothetical protein
MSPTLTILDDGVLWERGAYFSDVSRSRSHIRLRLKRPEPAILVDQKKNVIVAANEAWQKQCGYSEDAIGLSPKILQGELTDEAKAARFAQRAYEEGRAGTTLVNYKADGSPFQHTIVAEKIGDFFICHTSRAVDVRASASAPQLFAIAAALLLTWLISLNIDAVLPSKGLSTDVAPSQASTTPAPDWAYYFPAGSLGAYAFAYAPAGGYDGYLYRPFRLREPSAPPVQELASIPTTLTTLTAALAAEATPLVGLSLLALLVVVLHGLTSTDQPAKKEEDDFAVAGKLDILGPLTLAECFLTAAVCIFLVAQGPLQVQLCDEPFA